MTIAELGRGGMGVAYRALQIGLGREVCVKLLFADLNDAEWLCRFAVEARAVGRLDDANVVRVFDNGVRDGVPFLVMELVPGGSLADRIKAGALAPRRAAEVVRDAARGVQAVHDAGIVHRDIKPANILMAADGTAKVADFGLAKLIDDAGDLTGTQRAMGTPHYMAPEQAEGQTRDAGPAADVWSLGATLYACLTGRAPFRGKTPAEVLARVKAANPVPPRSVNPSVPRDLEAVCLKCLEKDPKRRYGTAAELRDDLGRWLDGHPVRARRAGVVRRAISWTRRNPRRAFLAAAVGVVPAAVVGGFWAWGVDWLDEQLKKGKGAELFGRSGRPRHLACVAGSHSSHVVTTEGDVFGLQAQSPALWELARSPYLDRFRFECQVRHERSSSAVVVGLYFGHTRVSAGSRAVHQFAALLFNDVVSDAKVLRQALNKNPQVKNVPFQPQPNRLFLAFCVYSPLGWREEVLRASLQEAKVINAYGGEFGPWRSIAVDVTPESVQAYWGETPERLVAVPDSVSVEGGLKSVRQACDDQPPNHPARGLPWAFRPDGGIGLFAQGGTVSFRGAVVTPF